MSMWLSAANTAANSYAGAARGAAVAETRRAQKTMVDEMTRQTMAFWFPAGLAAPAVKPRRKRRASSKS